MSVYNIYPLADLEEHNTDDVDGANCHCQPKVEEFEGSTLIIHNAFDQREIWEEFEAFHKKVLQ